MALRVLVVDDNAVSLMLVGRILGMEGYEMLTAESGAEAIRCVEQTPPDLIIMDVMMPDMDGYELCRRLRQNPASARLPIFMLTAMSDENERQRGLAAGANDYLGKPFNLEELRQRVKLLLDNKEPV